MKIKLYIFLLFFCPIIGASQVWTAMTTDDGNPGDYVHIYGETNVNCFECDYDRDWNDQADIKVLTKFSQVPGQTIKAYIPVSKFECSNSMMYNDFQELLSAAEYPYITIEIDPSQIRNIIPGKSSTVLDVSITIANVTIIQHILCGIDTDENSIMSITGESPIRLADFDLIPPVKFMGLVKVRDNVTISFSFNFIVA